MKILPVYAVIFGSMLALSCNSYEASESINGPTKETMAEESIKTHRLSENTVMDYAQGLRQELMPSTRSVSITSVRVIQRKDLSSGSSSTRSSDSQGGDTLVLAVNFADDQGFMLLSPDDRVPLLAITDQGEFTSEILENPGLRLFLEQSELYALESIRIYDSVMNVCDKSQINTRIVGPTKPSDPPFFGAQLKTYTSREYFEPSSTMPNILPLLKTTWHQNSPFNDLAPKCYVRDCTEPHYAGCIPVAIAQVGAYHQRPVMRFG